MHSFVKSGPDGESVQRGGRWADVALLAAGALVLAWGLGSAALWDPLEIDLADRARNPTAGDAAAAVVHQAFRLFGETAGAARAAMAIAMVIAMVATWALVARVESVQTARFVPVVFSTTPSLFVHGRTALPDALVLACVGTTFAALGAFALDERSSLTKRLPALVLGGLALAAGQVVAGPLLGIAVPSGSIAAAVLLGARRQRSTLAFAGALAIAAAVAVRFGIEPTVARGAPFDGIVATALHGAFPWSALLPIALVRVRDRPVDRAAWIFAAALTGAETYLRNHREHVPDAVPMAIVLLAALALGARAAEPLPRPAILAALVLCLLLGLDFDRIPTKATAAYGDVTLSLPRLERGATTFHVATALAMASAVFALAFARADRRRLALALGFFGGAFVLRALFYPGVANAASPGEAFAAYREARRAHEPLGALGISGGALRFAHVGAVAGQIDAAHAYDWLSGDGRRFLVAPRSELAALNARHREARQGNIPVIGGADTSVLLLSNRGSNRDNPLSAIVRDDAPNDVTKTDVRFGEALDLLGYAIERDDGATTTLSSTASVHLKLYWRVLRAPVGHCTFIHLDRAPARFAAEHTSFDAYPIALWHEGDVIVDDYAVRLPLAFRGSSAPAYVGVGDLPCNDDRRMAITRGESDGHGRSLLGRLVVR